ncbi:metal-dependent protease [Novosphingobium sp. Rr 2-17]|uniref:M67 family metallopeptidase n=1 Tax=Novosphingobium sp. Rr 2-17 TaxID=555793 RepID=UPI000269889C|nr:M67 family metallopeptidase [Novosphingobium sp. Rr 2-17]EIZ78592.1 metal-dependent protease [Novosphingobium sp. Rr 2-17]
MDVEVTSGVLAALHSHAIHSHAIASGAEECCGLLLGHVLPEGGERIETAVPTANVAPDRRRHFEVDPRALLAAHKAARGGGPQVLGYYHSHPEGPAAPSVTDQEHSTGDCRIWAIIAHGTVAFWRDTGNGFSALAPNVVA